MQWVTTRSFYKKIFYKKMSLKNLKKIEKMTFIISVKPN